MKKKTGVIIDPLGQSTVLAGSDCRLILKFWDERTYGRTDTLCENSDHYYGRPRGSKKSRENLKKEKLCFSRDKKSQ